MDGVPANSMGVRFALFAAIAFLALSGLGWRGTNEPDESRYGEIAREMVVSGDYITPRIKGVPHYAKPPMTYWATAGALKLFGFAPWVLRLPSALASLLVACLLWNWGGRRDRCATGYVAALVFLTSLEVAALGRILTTDMILTASATLALWSWWRRNEAKGYRALFWLAMGLGFLTKGPIILLIVFGALGGAAIAQRDPKILQGLSWRWGLPLFLLLGLSWYAVIVFSRPEVLDYFLGEEVVARVSEGKGRAKPLYYFLLVLPLGLLPWTPFLIGGFGRSHGVFIAWIVVPFCVFTLASSKLWTYMLPLLPATSMIVAQRLMTLRNSEGISWDLICARVLFFPAFVLARLSSSPSRRRTEFGLSVLIMAIAIQGILWKVGTVEESLGHNASYQRLFDELGDRKLVGAELPQDPATLSPEIIFPPEGLAVVSYGLKAPSADLFLLRDRAEYVPNFDGHQLFEMESDRRKFSPRTRTELVRLLSARGQLLVLIKDDRREEFDDLDFKESEVLARCGEKKSAVTALLIRYEASVDKR